ncbi:MAG: hypothetical protein OXG36_00060 [Caldilineaceae bacterium]|nr:hypothetical protein [Caldilineaceae bacterium]
MPLNVTWEWEDSTLGGQLGDKAAGGNAAKRQEVLNSAIGADDRALLPDLEQLT